MILSTAVATAAAATTTTTNNQNTNETNTQHGSQMIAHRRRHCTRRVLFNVDTPTTATATATTTITRASCRRRRCDVAPLSLVVVVVVVLSIWVALASCFPSGAPEQACKDLKPGHGAEPSSEPSPFELTQDKLQVAASGDQIKVMLSSPSKTNFKGLLVQALNEKGEPVGKFLPGKGLKNIDSCSAVTHSDREAKKTASLVWEAPAEFKSKEAVVFRATVVQKFDEFHMNIKSTLQSKA